jgi:hypothetical protein
VVVVVVGSVVVVVVGSVVVVVVARGRVVVGGDVGPRVVVVVPCPDASGPEVGGTLVVVEGDVSTTGAPVVVGPVSWATNWRVSPKESTSSTSHTVEVLARLHSFTGPPSSP